jgi:hypothetical protein
MEYGPALVEAITNSPLDVRLMQGKITLRALTDECSRGPWDMLWIIAHGNDEGFLLSDGLLKAEGLVQLTRGRFKTVYLNSCSSLKPALMLIRNKDDHGDAPDVICTLSALPDITSYLTGARFVQELVDTHNHRRAYDRAAPGDNENYLFLAGMSNDFLLLASL